MKVLVVNLLRLGDIISSAPVLAGLRKKYPESQIDLLINSQFSFVHELLPSVANVHRFPRVNLQEDLVDPDKPLLGPYDQLNKFLENINKEKYDLVVNLTHNKLSGWVCALIEAEKHEGLCFFEPKKPYFGSSWFRYLNDFADEKNETPFHYTDIFINALQLDPSECQFEVPFSKSKGTKNQIALQVLTSDKKKNWGLNSYKKLIENIRIQDPKVRFIVLAAPSEEVELRHWVESFDHDGCIDLYVCSLREALEVIDESKLFITGDTSIKHLACATQTQILEICIGSSQFRRTGAYKEGALIVKPRTPCWPCVHSESCSQPQHQCALDIEVQGIVDVALCCLEGRDIEAAATEVLRVRFCALGYWDYVTLSKPSTSRFDDIFEKGTWKFFLDQKHKEPMAEYGTFANRLAENLELQSGLTEKEKTKLLLIEKNVNSLNSKLRDRLEQSEVLKKSLAINLDQPVYDITAIRKEQISAQENLERGQIKEKLIRTINTKVMELV